jgi:DNA-binding NarL/FixJ family response regulator
MASVANGLGGQRDLRSTSSSPSYARAKPQEQQLPARILIVDSHPVVRWGLRDYIRAQNDLTICGEAADAASAFGLLAHTVPHLAILDLTLKGSHGLELIKDIRVQRYLFPILVWSAWEEDLYGCCVRKAGAQGYLNKADDRAHLDLAVRRLLAGGTYFSDTTRSRLLDHGRRDDAPTATFGEAGLSDRERQVFTLLGNGLTGQEISQRLKLDHHTVESYQSRLCKKFGTRTTAQLRLLATHFNLLKVGQARQSPARHR